MDESRFDDLSKTIGAQRRTVIRGLLAGLLLPIAGVVESGTEAARNHRSKRRVRRRRQRRRANNSVPSSDVQAGTPGIKLRVVNKTDVYLLARYWHGTIGWVRDEGGQLVRDREMTFDTSDLHAGIEIWNYAAHPFIWAEQPVAILSPPSNPIGNIESGGSMEPLGYLFPRAWDRRELGVGDSIGGRVQLDAVSSIGVTLRRENDENNRRVFSITLGNP